MQVQQHEPAQKGKEAANMARNGQDGGKGSASDGLLLGARQLNS